MVGLCRLCAALKKPDLLITINEQSSEICQRLQKCCRLYINVNGQDNLPKSVCQECVECLNNSYKFFVKVQEAQETLQAFYPSPPAAAENIDDSGADAAPAPLEEEYKKKQPLKCIKKQSSKIKIENDVPSQPRTTDDNTDNTNSPSDDDNDIEHPPTAGNVNHQATGTNSKPLKEGLPLIKAAPEGDDPKNPIKRLKKTSGTKIKTEDEVLSQRSSLDEYTESTNSFTIRSVASLSEDVNCNEGYLEEVYNLLGMTKDDVSEEQPQLEEVALEGGHFMEEEEVEQHIEVETVENDQTHIELEDVILAERAKEDVVVVLQEEYEEDEEDEEECENPDIEERDEIKDFSTLPPELQLSTWNSYTYLCYACDYKTISFGDLFVHTNSIHSVDNFSQLHYKCYDCQQLLVHYSAFLNHARLRHHPALKLRCDACDILCNDYQQYENHRNVICSEANKYPDVLPCRHCCKNFHSSYGLKTHITQHHTKQDKKKYPCTECNKEFAWKRSLKTHEMTHTHNREYACDYCDKQFYNKSNLESHIYTHFSEKWFKCNICQKSFKTPTILAKHQTLHTDNKPFKCSFCPKQFRSKIEQTTHERVHTGEKNLQCKHCEKRFRFRSALTAHHKVHSGVKAHACKYCPKTFIDTSNFKKHVRRKHSDKETI